MPNLILKSNNPTVVAFRVDASVIIGTGHVMRCLSLANILRECGTKSYFICRAHPGHMAEKIKAEGYDVILLPLARIQGIEGNASDNYASWLGASLLKDASETIQHLKENNPVWLVVDHFALNSIWEMRVKEVIDLNIMVIDGLANRKHECDLLLDQTYSLKGEDRWKNLVPKKCKLLVGPKYALLRAEFIEAQRHLRQRDGKVKRIFIAFGGVDELNATSITLDALIELNKKDISVDVVIGITNPNRKNLIEKYHKIDYINIFLDPNNIADLMAAADLAIGACGTMMWERCLLTLPTLIITVAQNQITLAESLHSINAAVYIGDISEISCDSIKVIIEKYLNNAEKLIEIQRVCEELMSQEASPVESYLLESAQ